MSFLSLLGPALGFAGALIGGNKAASAQKKANETNIALQREQQEWEANMSNTAWRRAVEDMKYAGINPMLAVSQGGASTPNVSAATVQPVEGMARGITEASRIAGTGLTTALTNERMRIDNDIQREKLAQERLNTGEMTAMKDPGVYSKEIQKRWAETETAVSTMRLKAIETKIAEDTIGYNVSSAKARSQILDQEVTMNEAKNILLRLDIPEKQAMAKWFETVGAASPATKAIMSISQWLKFILGR